MLSNYNIKQNTNVNQKLSSYYNINLYTNITKYYLSIILSKTLIV